MFSLFLLSVSSASWFSTKGNKIVNSAGQTVRLSGLNWFGFETSASVFHGLWNANLHTVVQQVSERGFNVFRVPVSLTLLHSWKDGKPPTDVNVNYYANPDLEGLNSQEIFDMFLAECKKYQVRVFIDVHGITPDSYTYVTWSDSSHPPEYLYSALEWFADHYKNDDTIIAIDVKNEPHGKCDESNHAKWDSSSDDTNWKHAAETAGSRILAKNPNLLILVEGIECYQGTGNWWGGNFLGVHDYPINLGSHQSQLVYSPHEYGPSVWDQPWFSSEGGSFTYDSLLRDHWRPSWLFIVEDGIAPLLIGEWGGHLQEPNLKWLQAMVKLIGEFGLSQTFWCLNPNSGDTGGLILEDWETWDEDKYKLIKPILTDKL